MSSVSCRHALVSPFRTPGADAAGEGDGGGVSRCRRHSREGAGASVWVWGTRVRPYGSCPCRGADRFVVVAESAATCWRQAADVVLGRPRPTVGCAVAAAESCLAGVPGCALVSVPVGAAETVLATRGERLLLRHGARRPRACAVCVYPWLAGGHRLAALTAPSREQGSGSGCVPAPHTGAGAGAGSG